MIRLACFNMYGPYGLGVVEMTADDIDRLLRRYETYLSLRKTDDPPDEITYKSPIRWFREERSFSDKIFYQSDWFVLNDDIQLPDHAVPTVSDRIHVSSSGGRPWVFHRSHATWSTDVFETEVMDLDSLAVPEILAPDGR